MAGLLDLFKTEGAKYLRDILPGGLLNPEVPPDAPKTIAGLLPVVGDAISGYDALEAARRGDIGEAALNSLGLLPFVPAMGGVVKYRVRDFPDDVELRAIVEAFENEKRVGAATFKQRRDYIYPTGVMVEPEYRGKGVATEMYKQASNIMDVEPSLQRTFDAKKLWEKLEREGMAVRLKDGSLRIRHNEK